MVAYMPDETLFDRATVVVQGVVWRRTSIDGVMPVTQLEVEAVECFAQQLAFLRKDGALDDSDRLRRKRGCSDR